MRAQSSGWSHFGFRPPEGGTPCVRQVCSPGFSRWGADTSRRVGLFDAKNSSSAERNERSERIRGLDANAATHLPGEWHLLQNFFSFGHSTAGLRRALEGGTTCLWSSGFSRFLVLSAAILRIAADFEQSIDNMPDMTYRSSAVNGKPLRWLHGEVKTSPMSIDARKGDRDAFT